MPASEIAEKALAVLATDKSKALGLSLGKHVAIEPGQWVSRADAKSAPGLFFPSGSPEKTYLVVCLDLDAPFISFPFLSPINHWCQSGLRLSPAQADGKLETSDPSLVAYIGPGPPPGAAPHRYVFFLYEQPGNFDIGAHAPGRQVGRAARMRYDLGAFEKEMGLGEVVAVNYFTSN